MRRAVAGLLTILPLAVVAEPAHRVSPGQFISLFERICLDLGARTKWLSDTSLVPLNANAVPGGPQATAWRYQDPVFLSEDRLTVALPAEGKCVVRLETRDGVQYFWDAWAHWTANDGRRYGLEPDLSATNLEVQLLRNDRLSRLVQIETAANDAQGIVVVGSVSDAPLNSSH